MLRTSLILLVVLSFSVALCEELEASRPADESLLQAVPRVPTLATIVGSDSNPRAATSKWVQDLMRKKETKARVEIVLLKQKLVAQQEAQDTEDRERARRKMAYDKAHGTLFDTTPVAETKKRSIQMKLDFQVAELESYRRLIEVCKVRAALANSVVESLTKLDRDSDGRLSGDEYRDAAHIFIATQRLFLSIDNDGDGYITLAEMNAALNLPADGAAAMSAGSGMRDAAGSAALIIKDFDTDKDGVLNINERKAISNAYLEISLKSAHEAEAYQHLLDEMLTARQASAAKFENLTIDLVEPK